LWHRLLDVDAAMPAKEYAVALRRMIDKANKAWRSIADDVEERGLATVLEKSELTRLEDFERELFSGLVPDLEREQVMCAAALNRKRRVGSAAAAQVSDVSSTVVKSGDSRGDDDLVLIADGVEVSLAKRQQRAPVAADGSGTKLMGLLFPSFLSLTVSYPSVPCCSRCSAAAASKGAHGGGS
jgi:hypothetical protein